MAAGDLLPTSGDRYAAEMRGLLMADDGFGGALWWITELTGFGEESIRDEDVRLDHGPGAAGGLDQVAEQPIILNLACHTGSAATAEAAYRLVRTAFTAGPDEELHLWAPEWGHVYLIGRGRGSTPKRINMAQGVMMAQATFLALDPTIYEVPAP